MQLQLDADAILIVYQGVNYSFFLKFKTYNLLEFLNKDAKEPFKIKWYSDSQIHFPVNR